MVNTCSHCFLYSWERMTSHSILLYFLDNLMLKILETCNHTTLSENVIYSNCRFTTTCNLLKTKHINKDYEYKLWFIMQIYDLNIFHLKNYSRSLGKPISYNGWVKKDCVIIFVRCSHTIWLFFYQSLLCQSIFVKKNI